MSMWNTLDRPLILASNSPRRKEILERLGFHPAVQPPTVADEAAHIRVDDLPASLAELALLKARSVAVSSPGALVLGGDTVVIKGEQIMGKPRSRSEGEQMLRSLSGGEHQVISGVGLVCIHTGFEAGSSSLTRVWFRELSSDEINRYLDTGEYLDKAGAYAIQGGAMAFVDRIDGCYYNVVGLPIRATIDLFETYRSRKE